jgi:hypothetical protein
LFELKECLILAGQKSFIVLLTKIEFKMRKLLFLSIAVAFSASAIAQNAHVLRPRVDVKNLSIMGRDNMVQNQNAIPRVAAKRVLPPVGNRVAGPPADDIVLSTAANAFGNFYIGKTRLEYNKDINTVALFHRNDNAVTGDPNTGYYRYDKSTDGGGTWSINQGPVWGPAYNSGNTVTGRYPVGTIGNPVGNTNPANGYEVYTGVWHTGVGTPPNTWHGLCWGIGKLDNATVTEHYESTNAAGNMAWIEDIFTTKTNVVWRMSTMELDNQGAYQDTLRVEKGVWNGSDYDYTSQNLHFKVNPDLGVRPYDMNIAFSDDGMTGYAVCINNADSGNMVYYSGTMYMQMYITHDGGATWGGGCAGDPNTPLDLDVTFDLDGQTLSPLGNAWFGNPDSTFGVTGWGAARPDFDMAVDGSGNLHILVGVFPQFSFGESIDANNSPGAWGLADLYTVDGGTNWKGQLVAKPNTYMGSLGDATNVMEGVRPFVTRSWDGTKMFFGWFDTPPIFSVTTNDFPEMYVVGWDMTSDMWTAVTDMTTGSLADGACGFGMGSYYAMDNGSGTYEIPGGYMTMSSDANGVCTFHYLDNANITSADFVNTAPTPIPLHSCTVGVPDLSKHTFSVSANYPNPFNGSTTIKVTLPFAVDVTIEVTNMVGQMMSSKVYTNLSVGENKLVIDGSSFAKGMYTYKVIAGKDVVTRTMMVR